MARAVSGTQKVPDKQGSFRRINGWLAAVYAVQGVFVLLLSATKLLPVEISYITSDPIAAELAGHPTTALTMRHIADINLAHLLSGIFFAAALAHLSAATMCRQAYEAGLKKRTNAIRWSEYAFSSGVLIVAIAMLAGARDLVALCLLFVAGIVSALTFWILEISDQKAQAVRRLFVGIGILTHAAVWLGVLAYLWASGVYGTNGLPAFMCILAGSALVLSVLAGVVMYLSLHRIGRWADYLCVERTYIVLGLVTKTVLVWQIFAGALRT